MIRYYARPVPNAAHDESVLFVHAERIKCHNPGHKSNDHKNLSLHPTVLSAMHTTLPEIPHVNMRESWGTFEWKRGKVMDFHEIHGKLHSWGIFV